MKACLLKVAFIIQINIQIIFLGCFALFILWELISWIVIRWFVKNKVSLLLFKQLFYKKTTNKCFVIVTKRFSYSEGKYLKC